MVEGIAFYALHKSRVLITPYKAHGFCLFIGCSYVAISCTTIEIIFPKCQELILGSTPEPVRMNAGQ